MKYLLDKNVLDQISMDERHEHVDRWLDSVDDSDIGLSVLSLAEYMKGIAKLRRSKKGTPADQQTRAAAADGFEADLAKIQEDFRDRILPISEDVAVIWGRLIGEKEKDVFDLGYAATAQARGLILVTRNFADFEGRGAKLLDPFKSPPAQK